MSTSYFKPIGVVENGVRIEKDADDAVVIDDEQTPLAAAEDNYFIHWIILILTLLSSGYSLVRAFVRIFS